MDGPASPLTRGASHAVVVAGATQRRPMSIPDRRPHPDTIPFKIQNSKLQLAYLLVPEREDNRHQDDQQHCVGRGAAKIEGAQFG
jgi:hypothetical protein